MTTITTLVLVSTAAAFGLWLLSNRPSPSRERRWAEKIRKTH